MPTEPADENCVIKMSGEGNFSYRGVTRTERKTFDFLTKKISSLEAKVKYARGFGLIIGVAKSSDCPEGKLAGATREGSELERLERGIADLICSEKEVLDLKAQLTVCEEGAARFDEKIQSLMDESERIMICAEEAVGRRFPIQGGPSIPWRMVGPHDRQCVANHDQTLEDLAKRGGLSPSEVLAVLDDVRWFKSKWRTAGEAECHDELERRRAAFEDPIKKLEEELETVHANWDADRQELEDVIADSVPIRPDENEVSAELLQIVNAILHCDEKFGPDKLCDCTRYIRNRFEALRSGLNMREGLLREFRNTLNVADIEPKVGITQINKVLGEETCRTCGVVLTDERTAKKADGSVRLDSFNMPWCDVCASRSGS